MWGTHVGLILVSLLPERDETKLLLMNRPVGKAICRPFGAWSSVCRAMREYEEVGGQGFGQIVRGRYLVCTTKGASFGQLKYSCSNERWGLDPKDSDTVLLACFGHTSRAGFKMNENGPGLLLWGALGRLDQITSDRDRAWFLRVATLLLCVCKPKPIV